MTTTTKTANAIARPALFEADAVGYPDCQPIIDALTKSELFKAWRPGVVGTIENAYFSDALGIETKDDYIALRETLKGWLRLMEVYQRALKAQCGRPGDQSMPQMYQHFGAKAVTKLIAIRRAGKIWSAAQAASKVEAAA